MYKHITGNNSPDTNIKGNNHNSNKSLGQRLQVTQSISCVHASIKVNNLLLTHFDRIELFKTINHIKFWSIGLSSWTLLTPSEETLRLLLMNQLPDSPL
ncbi:hypothetical protein Pst134EA_000921 [Puccinia striiformis f. sp. tritici]|uniref:hypothetical protein n=1 Tax=Puccinia striiformis f. sp. tritici TaxID=168172 RepID=UPI0020085BE6|nr:hypothetical protein Pst134EA_000921 [Puccinia striiformis f. sp. tritici]KAH9473859.1 hypothetical protein Pst134EA_000921 [Puccinia striiformis f. sp. tritici]